MVGDDYEVIYNIEYLWFYLWTVFGIKHEIRRYFRKFIAGGSNLLKFVEQNKKNISYSYCIQHDVVIGEQQMKKRNKSIEDFKVVARKLILVTLKKLRENSFGAEGRVLEELGEKEPNSFNFYNTLFAYRKFE